MAPEDWLDGIAERLRAEIGAGAAARGEKTTGRDLLSRFGYARRGRHVVVEIRTALEARQLVTVPDFEFEWVDNEIEIILDDPDLTTKTPSDPTVRIDVLGAAHNVPVAVQRDDGLVKATTKMRMEGFSQLPVMHPNGRDVYGVVSWTSIGEAHGGGRTPATVGECMVDAHIIGIDTPLADAAELIYDRECVLVRGKDKRITGIVTAADLARQFSQLARPFLLIGEIEHQLRNLVLGRFTAEELVDASGRDDATGPDDLTYGGYIRLLRSPEAWERLGLEADRVLFLQHLESVRAIRNDVMHFTPDPLDELGARQLVAMARFLGTLHRHG